MNNQFLQAIQTMIENYTSKLYYDKTFPSVVYGINDDGTYTIIKAGQKYNVKCAIPSADIKLGTNVWVRIPCNRLHEMHICGLK
jgi:hypothetical protein